MNAEQRIIPTEEALALIVRFAMVGCSVTPYEAVNLVHTAFVLGEQREAALKLHKPVPWRHGGKSGAGCSGCDWDYYPCPTARALGVEQS
jgi:hypothetical protein